MPRMMRSHFRINLNVFILLSALFAGACSGGAGSGGSPQTQGSSGPTGTLAVSLTDASGCNYDGVFVTIKKVRVHQSATAQDQDAGWIDIVPANGPTQVNLLNLQNGLMVALGLAPLPPGHYTQARLYLVPNSGDTAPFNDYVTVSGQAFPLQIPSGFQSGIKVSTDYDITAAQQEDLIIDFDACQSIVKAGSGTYLLRPYILIVRQSVSGTIAGAVNAVTSGAIVKAELNGYVYKQTKIKQDGTFVLYPLPDSSVITNLYPKNTAGTYDVVIVAEGYSTVLTTGVPVTAGSTTVLSTTASPIVLPTSPIGQLNGTIDPTSADARIRQTINGNPYQVDRQSVDLINGSYQLFLPTAAPLFGAYTTTPPISYTADNSAAGNYTIDTPNDDALYGVSSQNFAISSSSVTTINFTGSSALAPASGTAGTATGTVTVSALPPGFTSGTAILSATMDNENVNSTSVSFAASGAFSYTIDDLAPGTYSLLVVFAPPGLNAAPQSIQVTVPASGGTFSANNFTLSP